MNGLSAADIDKQPSIYNFLIGYFLPEIDDPYFRLCAAANIEKDARMTYCRCMAAWLPYEKHYHEILAAARNRTEQALQ